MRIVAMGVLLCLAANAFAQEPVVYFTGDRASETALRKTVRVNVNPHSAYRATGVLIEFDTTRFPKLLREGEVAVLTAAHVADRLGWDRKVTVQGIELHPSPGGRKFVFGEEFSARVVMLPDRNGPDIAMLAATIPKKLLDDGQLQLATLAKTPYAFEMDETLLLVGCPFAQPPKFDLGFPGQLHGEEACPMLSVSNTPVFGQSGGPVFNRIGELVALCSGHDDKVGRLFLGIGLAGRTAEKARTEMRVEHRQWGLYATLTPLNSLLTKANEQADALLKLELALEEYRLARKEE